MAHLTHVKQIVPSVKGDITVEVRKTENTYNLDLISPAETTVTGYIPKSGTELYEVAVNEEVIWINGKLKDKMTGLSFHQSDVAYSSFNVKGGVWNFRAVNK